MRFDLNACLFAVNMILLAQVVVLEWSKGR